jgi:transcriptional antiterminator RfaH
MERWYCARTKVNFSWDVVIQQLAQQNFTAWLPIVRHQSFQGGKKLITEQPLFPSHIFVEFDIDATRWRGINSTIGIVRLLPERLEQPLPLPQAFIAGLQARPSVGQVKIVAAKFVENETVRVLSGVFQNRFATVLSSTRNATRMRLEAFAGRDIAVTIPTGDLAPAAWHGFSGTNLMRWMTPDGIDVPSSGR